MISLAALLTKLFTYLAPDRNDYLELSILAKTDQRPISHLFSHN